MAEITGFLIFGILIFLFNVFLLRWVLRIDTMVEQLKYTNGLLIRMLQRQGATDEELRTVLDITAKDMPRLLKRDQK